MAALSRNFAVLPEPIFLSPQSPTKVLKLSISRTHGFESRCNIKILGTRIWAVKKEVITVLDEREKELETKVNANANGNGNGNGKFSYSNGSAGTYSNGSAKAGGLNGSLMKYVTGNGNGSAAAKTGVEVVKVDEVISGKKKTVEEIGLEDAWFKRKGKDQVEVSVAPGGRWNRFKTYSTIQRTLEKWEFVLSFIFKVWLSNKKFSYRGGMTEEKKSQRRKVLAKWLKENILRLGPTFIKIGQQFSTRVDILNMLINCQSSRIKFLLFHQQLLYQ